MAPVIITLAMASIACENESAGAVECTGDSVPFQEAWDEVYDYMEQVIAERELAGCPAISDDWVLPECWLRTGLRDGSRQDNFLDCYELPDCATNAAVEMAKARVIQVECNSFPEGVVVELATEILGAIEKENSDLW